MLFFSDGADGEPVYSDMVHAGPASSIVGTGKHFYVFVSLPCLLKDDTKYMQWPSKLTQEALRQTTDASVSNAPPPNRQPPTPPRLPVLLAPTHRQQATAKQELLDAIAPLKRGLTASEEDVAVVESLAQKLEKLNPNPK